GRPIANTRLYVLDQRGALVPIGASGELFIGGDGVALGYVNLPELTEEKFVPDPFSPRPGARLYKTGDLVRYLPDGNLEFLGRNDHQVKLRGFRIELGEIETVLVQHPDIREGVVLVREDNPGDRRLVAYVTPHTNLGRPIHEPRAFLKYKLPDYMIPSAIVELEQLPLTSNGKIDRRALPKPQQTESDAANFVAPRTPTEEVTAGIWADA